MTGRPFSVALFDFDGVILDSAEIKAQGFVECFSDESAPTREAIRAYVVRHGGVSRFEKFRYIHDRILGRALGDDRLRGLCERYVGIVLERVAGAPFVKGALELLQAIHTATDCFVVSGTPQAELRTLVRQRAIDHMFKDVVGSPAPKTELTENIVRRYDGRDRIVFIGDSITDYEAARRSDIAFLGVAGEAAEQGLPADVEVVENLTYYLPRFGCNGSTDAPRAQQAP